MVPHFSPPPFPTGTFLARFYQQFSTNPFIINKSLSESGQKWPATTDTFGLNWDLPRTDFLREYCV
jgi:hypothetical protein